MQVDRSISQALAGYDFGLAPLVRGRFNDCKSGIKVLDYAALGLPTMASAVPAYVESIPNGSCILVD